jgi:hypothetical protein
MGAGRFEEYDADGLRRLVNELVGQLAKKQLRREKKAELSGLLN